MFARGYLTLFSIRGVPVRAHWSVPFMALLMSGFRYAPGIWVGVILLVLWHELGHLFFVLRYGMRAVGVELNGFGGLCQFAGSPTPVERSIVAWGGVLFQMTVLIPALLVTSLIYQPTGAFESQLFRAFIQSNFFLIILNLMPIRPLDGAEAWKLFGRLRRDGWPVVRRKRKQRGRTAGAGSKRRVPLRAVDEEDVKKTVREALDRAARESRERGDEQP